MTAQGVDSSGWTTFVWTLKADVDEDVDADALITLRVTNPAAVSDGLLILNGASATAAFGSLVVNDDAPDTVVTWTLQAEALDIPPSEDAAYRWELDRFIGTRKERIGSGTVTVERSVRRDVTTP